MVNEIGKRIKNLRLAKGVTQEDFATYLGISYQAVSKWENEVTSPDIQLLPTISVYFGVTIDELFEIPKETQMERIENMIEDERIISRETLEYTEKFLQNTIKAEPKVAKAYYLLASLYNHQAKYYHNIAQEYAKTALKHGPYEKMHHIMLIEAMNGVWGDGHHNLHASLIEYYKEFVEMHPDYWSGYLFLLDQLISDGRLEEAKEILTKVKLIKPSYVYPFYQGDIEFASGNKEGAKKLWDKGVLENPQIWQAHLSRADRLVRLCRYEEAIADYEKAFEVQEKPRYVDSLVAMAQIYEILGNYNSAIEALEREIIVLRDENKISSGELVDYPMREITRLKRLL